MTIPGKLPDVYSNLASIMVPVPVLEIVALRVAPLEVTPEGWVVWTDGGVLGCAGGTTVIKSAAIASKMRAPPWMLCAPLQMLTWSQEPTTWRRCTPYAFSKRALPSG